MQWICIDVRNMGSMVATMITRTCFSIVLKCDIVSTMSTNRRNLDCMCCVLYRVENNKHGLIVIEVRSIANELICFISFSKNVRLWPSSRHRLEQFFLEVCFCESILSTGWWETVSTNDQEPFHKFLKFCHFYLKGSLCKFLCQSLLGEAGFLRK